MKTLSFAQALIIFLSVLIAAPSQAGADVPLPAIPDSLRAPQQRAEFLAMHFWDDIDFRDESFMRDTTLFESAFSTFASVLPIAGKDMSDVETVLHRLQTILD